MAPAALVGHRDDQTAAGAMLGPHHHFFSCDFGGLPKCPPGKRPINI